MRTIFTFNRTYFFLAILLLLIEVCIAIFVKDSFIRPYMGDVLVVILLYCFVRSFTRLSVPAAALAVLLFAYFVETLQYIKIVEKLGLQDVQVARIVIGNSFEWLDLMMYTLGFMIILLIERKRAVAYA